MRKRLLTLFFCLGLAPLVCGETLPWLYDVEVPVVDQSPGVRLAATAAALLQLLTRLTGLSELPDNEIVVQALKFPGQYYNEFRFVEREVIGDAGEISEELHMLVQFERNAVLRLLKAAELPIWRADRPRVLAWVVVQSEEGRRVVGAEDPSDFAVALTARALLRGVSLTLPLLDLEDQLAVRPAAVWRRLEEVLQPASARYSADLLLLGRVEPIIGGAWAANWELWLGNEQLPFILRGGKLSELGAAGVDFAVDELARRYAVLARESKGITLSVRGVLSPADYGALLRYLNRLEFVDEVSVTQVRGVEVALLLTTRADVTQLLSLFAVDQLLEEVILDFPSRYDAELAWRPR